MKPVQFLSNSPQIDNIIKGFTLTKSLFVSSILIGEKHTGKKTLMQTLFPNTVYIDASNTEELASALEKYDEIIIYNFEKLLNFENLNFENKRIIAIANHIDNSEKIEKKFAFIYKMPSLVEREDKAFIVQHFQNEIQEELMIEEEIKIEHQDLNFSENIKSLRASLYKELMIKTFKSPEIEKILFDYLFEHIEGNNAYREHLFLYEKPLIKAGLKKYKSQLKLSNILGLNRNTLRKKIQEHGIN
jgi:DNA-binding protein Fis